MVPIPARSSCRAGLAAGGLLQPTSAEQRGTKRLESPPATRASTGTSVEPDPVGQPAWFLDAFDVERIELTDIHWRAALRSRSASPGLAMVGGATALKSHGVADPGVRGRPPAKEHQEIAVQGAVQGVHSSAKKRLTTTPRGVVTKPAITSIAPSGHLSPVRSVPVATSSAPGGREQETHGKQAICGWSVLEHG